MHVPLQPVLTARQAWFVCSTAPPAVYVTRAPVTSCGNVCTLQARNFVLEVSMDQTVEQALGIVECEACGADTFEANLTCHSCKQTWDACVVSGYPVRSRERLVPRNNMATQRDDWNVWVGKFGTDPMTGTPATPMY